MNWLWVAVEEVVEAGGVEVLTGVVVAVEELVGVAEVVAAVACAVVGRAVVGITVGAEVVAGV